MKVKKLLVWLLVWIFASSSLFEVANAALMTAITVNPISGKPGETVTIDFQVFYKPEQLTSYTVSYLDVKTWDPIAPDKLVDGVEVGSLVTEAALNVEDYYPIGNDTLTITLQENNNQFIFYYEQEIAETCYMVRYLDFETAEDIAAPKEPCGLEVGTFVSETAIDVDGYIALEPTEVSLELAESDNEVIFYYMLEGGSYNYEDLVWYTVEYLYYGTDRPIRENKYWMWTIGSSITENAPNIPWYEIDWPSSASITLSSDETSNNITFYYIEEEPLYTPLALYTVKYWVCSSGSFNVLYTKNSWAPIGSTITENAVDIHNYRLVDFTEKTIEYIVEIPDGNRLYFCYEYDPTVIVPVDLSQYLPLPSGEVNVILPDGVSAAAEVVNGIGSVEWEIPEDFHANDYNINVRYNGNDIYILSEGDGTATVLPLDTTMTINTTVWMPGDIIDITIIVTDENNNPVDGGDVVITYPDGTLYTVAVNDGEATAEWEIPVDFDEELYGNVIYADYLGTSGYNPCNSSSNIEIRPIRTYVDLTVINAEEGYEYYWVPGDTFNITALVTDENGNLVTDGEVDIYTYDRNWEEMAYLGTQALNGNGEVATQWTVPDDFPLGYYYIEARYRGSDRYFPSLRSEYIELKLGTTITIEPVTWIPGDTLNITALVIDENGNPVTDGDVDIHIYDLNREEMAYLGTLTLNDNGEVATEWTIPDDFSLWEYEIRAYYDGTDSYYSQAGWGSLIVNTAISALDTTMTIDASSGKVGDTINISIVVTDENGDPVNSGDVTVLLPDQTTQTVSVTNGNATVSRTIPQGFSAWQHAISANYLGNESYNPTTANSEITVNATNSWTSWWGGTSGWWGGGWGSSAKKDNCPDGDYSDSYYDGTCGQKPTQKDENKDNDSNGNIDNSESDPNYSQEMNDAYKFAHFYWITTMPTIKEADMDGYIIRSHLAKMMSQFAINVVWAKPNIWKEWCDKFNDIANETDELKWYMKTACELWLMWLHADGKTVKDNFDPNDYVTRAEFGTVLSRFLYLDENNLTTQEIQEWAEWYSKHLSALKLNWIMTQIDGQRITSKELRWYVMLMLMRSAQK